MSSAKSEWSTLNDEQKEQIKQAFEISDADHNGFIDLEELRNVLDTLGEEATEENAKKLMKEIDTDGNGLICFTEFREAMAAWWKQANV